MPRRVIERVTNAGQIEVWRRQGRGVFDDKALDRFGSPRQLPIDFFQQWRDAIVNRRVQNVAVSAWRHVSDASHKVRVDDVRRIPSRSESIVEVRQMANVPIHTGRKIDFGHI